MKARTFAIVHVALMLALLAATVPPRHAAAQGEEPNCPPINLIQDIPPAFLKSLPKECLKKNTPTTSSQIRVVSQFALQSSGGPDDFGYTFDDTVPFDWISASIPLGVGGDDAYTGPSSIGGGLFSFPFYGTEYWTHYTSTNGLITFDQGSCCDWGGGTIPSISAPNNFIAPFWDDLVVGAPYNSGGIYWDTGGTAPDRYYVVEWRDVTTYYDTTPFSFEVILFENGDIVIQHQSLPASYYSTVGIEDSTGYDGLQYHSGGTGLSAPKAIKFFYPTAPTPRLQVTPLSTGKFARTNADVYFPLTIKNNGSAGTDTYDFSAISAWSASFYQDGCVTPLPDTDADTAPDTGPLSEGSSTTICVGFTPPAGSGVGDGNSVSILVASSLDPVKSKTAEMNMTIPTSFAQVFEDYENAAMAFRVNQPEGILTNYPTDDFYYGDGLATIGLPDGRYLYAWHKTNNPNYFTHSDIEFTFLSNDRTTSTPVEKLTNNANNNLTMDFQPSVAVTPNGTIGVIWYRFLADDPGGVFVYNFNIYFATISNTGDLLSGPVNVTNNNLWDAYDDINVPHYSSPTIAGTDDNRFVLSWDDYRTDGTGNSSNNIWYSIFDASGTTHVPPTAFTNDNESNNPVLNPLSGGNVIITWNTFTFINPVYSIDPYYSIMDSDGTIVKTPTPLETDSYYSPDTDAVLLSNGFTAIMLGNSFSVSLFMLDENYNITSGPHYASTPNTFNGSPSVTYDASNRIIMTWEDQDSYPAINLMYALADDTGTFITNPISVPTSASGLVTSNNGQGNAPYPLTVQKQVLDDFNRPDGLVGENWSGNKARYRISDNQLLVKYTGSNTDIYWNEAFGPDQETFITFNKVNENATEQNILLKAQSNHTWGDGVIEVLYDAQNHVVQVWTWEWPQGWVKYGDDIPVIFQDRDTFRAVARSNGIVEVHHNGLLLDTRDITTWSHYADGGYIGLWFIDAKGATLDDFGGGTLP